MHQAAKPLAGNLQQAHGGVLPPCLGLPAAQAGPSSTLNFNDPWLASALAVAVKAHIEAVPSDAANIRARGFGLKTVGDLAQYFTDIKPIVDNARTVARQRRIAAKKQPVLEIGAVQAAHLAVTAQAVEKLP